MSDNITLPREVAYQVPLHELLESVPLDARLVIDDADGKGTRFIPVGRLCREAATALRTALAAEPTKPSDSLKAMKEAFRILTKPESGYLRWQVSDACDILRTAIRTAQSALAAEKRHPDYVIGNHWFETAYERLCAGEAEDAILEDYEVVREPRLRDLRRDAERYRWVLGWLVRSGLLSCETCRIDSPASYGNWWILRKPRSIDGGSFVAYGADLRDTIDAAMEASTAPASAAADASTAPEAKP